MRRLIAAVLALVSVPALAQPVTVDSQLPPYVAGPGVSGSLKSMGSDTMNNLMAHWGEEFKRAYPNVKIEVEGKGSSSAPPALIEGQVQFGPMSRPMKAKEMDDFEKKFGYKPTGLTVAIDTLAIYVNKDCPLTEISIDQAAKVFSVSGPDMTWDQLGVKDAAYQGKPVSLYGRNSASGTYGYFKEHTLGGKDFKATVKEQPGSSAVVQAVANDPFAMGYSGLGYRTAGVRALKVAPKTGQAAVEASMETAYSGDYPIARALLLYVNYDAKTGLDPLRAEFIKMIFSRNGQEGVVKDGYFPVPAELAREELKKVGIKASF
ncbi:MAG: phosphate ABC transporter substrate-binding protein [Phycisphaerae bacterium]|nr:phosphate ABC transporter substrate-binding protein [Phycisphaerae bacterium]